MTNERAMGPTLPRDEHNRELLENVHPPDWTNPEPADRYHLVVLGGGTAGLVSAAGAAGLGARVALVERHLLGGDCLNVGCVPSKGMIAAARTWETVFHGRRTGAPPHLGSGDFATAMKRMRRLRAEISRHDSAARFRDLGVDVFFGAGRFTGDGVIDVGGTHLRFSRAVVATGSRPASLPITGLDEAGYLTNETVFSLTELPRRLAVVGGGPIGCELAQSFARFGSSVTLFDVMEQILPREDAEAAEVVAAALEHDGVRLELGAHIEAVEIDGGSKRIRFSCDGETDRVTVDEILLSVGRKPNVEGLGLEAAGVEFGSDTGVEIDENFRTTNRRVFACGDVASRYQFTHAADAQAREVLRHAFFYGVGSTDADDLVIPWCTYTSPEVAHVGMYEEEAEEAGHEVETIRVDLAEVDRAVLEDETDGFLKIHLPKGSDEILGATIVAADAGDLVAEICLAMTHGIGLGKIAGTIHPYPTRAEILKKAADEYNRRRLTPLVQKLLGLRFKLLR